MTYTEFTNLSHQEAYNALEKCCVSKTWITKMIEKRSFASADALLKKAATIWYTQCDKNDWKEAFTGHPIIGDVASLREKFANTKNWATNEQAKIADAGEQILHSLAKANADYLKKFGYIFIVSASGKSAKEMLQICSTRLHNSVDDELAVAMGEQHKITVIRLAKLLDNLNATADLRSHITTHVLDTTTGMPGKGMSITLKGFTNDIWKPITSGITNNDGRILDLLPPGKNLDAGNYQMVFDTDTYYKNKKQEGFYPEVVIQFTVTNHEHYHVPLLINPFGYTTYKGS